MAVLYESLARTIMYGKSESFDLTQVWEQLHLVPVEPVAVPRRALHLYSLRPSLRGAGKNHEGEYFKGLM